jgi:hypothetical protein
LPKGDRGTGKRDSEIVVDATGVFIQAGSGKIMYTIFKLLVVIASWLIRFLDVAVSICKWVAKCKPLRFHASFLLLGICRACREKLKTMRLAELTATVKELETQMEGLLLQVGCAFD